MTSDVIGRLLIEREEPQVISGSDREISAEVGSFNEVPGSESVSVPDSELLNAENTIVISIALSCTQASFSTASRMS